MQVIYQNELYYGNCENSEFSVTRNSREFDPCQDGVGKIGLEVSGFFFFLISSLEVGKHTFLDEFKGRDTAFVSDRPTKNDLKKLCSVLEGKYEKQRVLNSWTIDIHFTCKTSLSSRAVPTKSKFKTLDFYGFASFLAFARESQNTLTNNGPLLTHSGL